MVTIKVEVISDIVCAWCYIGKRTLERAISLYQKTYPGGKHDVFIIIWRPYYLNYAPPTHSVEKSELAKTKLAGWSAEKVAAATNRVNQVGRSVGINFKSGGKVGSTRDAHRLIDLSQQHCDADIQNALVDKLFEAYHECELDVSDREVLLELAVEAGVERSEAQQWLQSDAAAEKVDHAAEQNRAKVDGVPSFIIHGKHHVDGAQDISEFLELFIKVKEEQ